MIKEASKDFAGFMAELDGEAVLVEVYTPLCVPCQDLKKNILPNVADKVTVLTVNAAENLEGLNIIQGSIGSITSVPVLALFRNGGLCGVHRGTMTLEELEEFIEE